MGALDTGIMWGKGAVSRPTKTTSSDISGEHDRAAASLELLRTEETPLIMPSHDRALRGAAPQALAPHLCMGTWLPQGVRGFSLHGPLAVQLRITAN